ncbi:O-antigen ligase family protein [Aggregatimonas sangjinii]|uniref:O-antigen ligase family protein n=1 Tax=Aggregatimonas sangjinii TaxID=2583587 RepID=A0A5B7SWU7_9FLAO|nr:O-antigen ligase family protein [Aggregatimonas sangjinii]QCX01663.1 O-antigen ligase family protein [Aggregatimonas sangjinii]
MNDFADYFEFEMGKVHLSHFYLYFIFAAATALYLIRKSKSKYKWELFFICFYLLTGNINQLLTIKIPGISFFEIQPERFIFLLLSFFILRKSFFKKNRPTDFSNGRVPWFQVMLFAYIFLLIVSIGMNISELDVPDALKTILESFAFLVIIIAFRLMADVPSYKVIGKSMIIGAIVSSTVSLIQLGVNSYFLRIGDFRPAFGDAVRSNGIFNTEYYNAYYLIIAISWALVSIKNKVLRISLVSLFSLGVLSSFQRMSWIILALVLFIYVVYINKIAIQKLALAGLFFLAILLSTSIFYYQDIMNSAVVKERLADSPGGRQGYYTMVIENIGKKPLFGYGGLTNEVYYTNLLRITRDRDRATATTGSIHSGYFSVLFEYGIPALACFSLFVILSVVYYSTRLKDNIYFVVPFLVGIIFMIGNLTNTFLFLSYISLLYAIHIGMGMGINHTSKKIIS